MLGPQTDTKYILFRR